MYHLDQLLLGIFLVEQPVQKAYASTILGFSMRPKDKS